MRPYQLLDYSVLPFGRFVNHSFFFGQGLETIVTTVLALIKRKPYSLNYCCLIAVKHEGEIEQ